MIIERWLQPNCSEGTIQINRKDLSYLSTKEQKELATSLNKYAGQIGMPMARNRSFGYYKGYKFSTRNYKTCYFYQTMVPHDLLKWLRKKKIEFYGDDFVDGSGLKKSEMLEYMEPTKIEKFAKGEYKKGEK